MSEPELISKLDVPLHVDVRCYECKKRIALSNAIEVDGRKYCSRCAPGTPFFGELKEQ